MPKIRDGALTVGRNDDEILVYTKKDGNVLNQPGEDLERIVGRVYADFESAFSSIESAGVCATKRLCGPECIHTGKHQPILLSAEHIKTALVVTTESN